jgi:hypothetical protein
MTNKNHPIALCLAPIKADAIARAEKEAIEFIDRVKVALEAAGYDLRVYAPNSSNDIGMYRRRLTAERLTEWTESTYRPNQPMIVRIVPEKVAKFVKDAKEDTAAQYDLFVMKMITKAGTVDTATIEGNHVWGYSILTVTKPGNVVERWKTQQIVNVSKLGLLFNQWPSRKIK